MYQNDAKNSPIRNFGDVHVDGVFVFWVTKMKVAKWERWGWEEVKEKERVKKRQREREMAEGGARGGGRRERVGRGRGSGGLKEGENDEVV